MKGAEPVLLIIQDWKTRVLIRAELKERGIEALGVDNIKDGLDWLESPLPYPNISLVLIDLSSPTLESDDLSLLFEKRGDAPILIVGSRLFKWTLPSDVESIYKPFTVQEVVEKIKGMLKQKGTYEKDR